MQGNMQLLRERNCCVKLITDAAESASVGVVSGISMTKATTRKRVHEANNHWKVIRALFTM